MKKDATEREVRLVRASRLALDRLESLVDTTSAEDYGSGQEAKEVIERDWEAVEGLRKALRSYD